jgi:starvation-inducible DNA-binding protein
MNELIATLRLALGNTFLMYYKAQAYHWNVEGADFSQYHKLFGKVYEDLYGAVDPLAENLRKLDTYAPISIMELYNYKTIEEDSTKPVLIAEMLSNLLVANTETYNTLSKVFDLATTVKEQGLANFAADRMDAHRKHAWMLKASLKKVG